MSIESDWRAIEAELAQRSPQILADLRPPITEAEAVNWSAAAGELPASLRELYSVHAGTATRGAGGFCFIGNWHPLTVDQALVRYERCRRMADLWARDPLIPFAFDPTGSHLGVRPGDGGDLSIIFDDTPDMPYETYPDIETLTAETVEGLRGNSADYRGLTAARTISGRGLPDAALRPTRQPHSPTHHRRHRPRRRPGPPPAGRTTDTGPRASLPRPSSSSRPTRRTRTPPPTPTAAGCSQATAPDNPSTRKPCWR